MRRYGPPKGEPDGMKTFLQDRRTGSDWESGKPKGPKRPCRLPELLATPDAPGLIVEGERNADRVAASGLTATTASEGAGKWTADLGNWFRGRTVYVIADNDAPGRAHVRQVATSLHGIAAEVRVVELPGLPHKGDVSDWLAASGNTSELLRLCEAAALWTPEVAEGAGARPPAPDQGRIRPEPPWPRSRAGRPHLLGGA